MRGYLICLMVISAVLLAHSAEAAVTSVQLVLSNGSVSVPLGHDINTQSYADGSQKNPNIYLKICADNSADLQNNFAALFYRVGDASKEVDIFPAQLVNVDGNNCSKVDLDFSVFKALYPGIPSVGLDDNPEMTSPAFTDFSEWTGFLDGDFIVRYFESSPGILNVTVTRAIIEYGEITKDEPFIVIGIQNSTDVYNETIVSLDESVLMDLISDFVFNVNGLAQLTTCLDGTALCQDGTCNADCAATDDGNAGCTGAANAVCEIGEGCACADCYGQQDSCFTGLICDRQSEICRTYDCGNGVCDTGETNAICPADCPAGGGGGAGIGEISGFGTPINITEKPVTPPIITPTKPKPVCGNDVCEAGENFLTCPADCLRTVRFIPPYFFTAVAILLTLLLAVGVGYRVYTHLPPAPRREMPVMPLVGLPKSQPPRLAPRITVRGKAPEDIQQRLDRIRKSLEEISPEKPAAPQAPVKMFVPKQTPKPQKPEIKLDHKVRPKEAKELKTKLSKNLKDIEKLLK